MLIYKERVTEFLAKLESPRSSRYAYRLAETNILDLENKVIMDTEKLKSIIYKPGKRIWDNFNACFLNYNNESIDTESVFVNDVFLSNKRYSVVLQIYVVPWAQLDLFYDNYAIGVIYNS